MSPTKKNKSADYEVRIAAACKAFTDHPESTLTSIGHAYGISRQTLSNRFHGRTKAVRKAHVAQQALTEAEEQKITDWVLEWDEYGLAPKHKALGQMVVTVLNARDGGNHTQMGRHHTQRLLKRNPQIATRVAQRIETDRLSSFTREKVDDFFNKLKRAITNHKIKRDDIWNVDEKGWQIGSASGNNELVVASSSRKNVVRQDPGGGEWFTIIESISAGGFTLPGFMIYAGAAHYMGWHEHEIEGQPVTFRYTKNGWSNDRVALEWLISHFNEHAKPSTSDAWRLLICDNHPSHDNFEFMNFCKKNKIELLFFPAHSTHALQPLDVGIFSPLGRYYGQELDNFIQAAPIFTKVRTGDMIPIVQRARLKALVSVNILSAFEACGISPYKRSQILKNPKINFQPTSTSKKATSNPTSKHSTRSRTSQPAVPTELIYRTELEQSQATEITILKEQVRKMKASQKPVTTDRRVITKARLVNSSDLQKARKARLHEEPPLKKSKRALKEGKNDETDVYDHKMEHEIFRLEADEGMRPGRG